MTARRKLAQIGVLVLGVVVSAVLGWVLFIWLPNDSAIRLVGVLLVVLTVLVGAKFAGKIAETVLSAYNVAEVAVEGPITRQSGSANPLEQSAVTSADDVIERIERADESDAIHALLVKMNTRGGDVVPSDDIRRAIANFDGPTIAYVTNTCASGGYWIASGCDEIYAREASIVGSIGVVKSWINTSQLLERLGVYYEEITAGEFKVAGHPMKQMTDQEREYLQGLVDEQYQYFVEQVADERDLDSETLRETEARTYLGKQAVELGLVDRLGTRDDVEERLESELDIDEVQVKELESESSLRSHLLGSAQSVAYSFGSGVASTILTESHDSNTKLR